MVIDAVQVSNHCDWDGEELERGPFKSVSPPLPAGINAFPGACCRELFINELLAPLELL